MSEEENTNNLPSADVLFDSSASFLPEYDYQRTDNLEFHISDNYRIA